jgi:hypothetical protein
MNCMKPGIQNPHGPMVLLILILIGFGDRFFGVAEGGLTSPYEISGAEAEETDGDRGECGFGEFYPTRSLDNNALIQPESRKAFARLLAPCGSCSRMGRSGRSGTTNGSDGPMTKACDSTTSCCHHNCPNVSSAGGRPMGTWRGQRERSRSSLDRP